MNNTHTLVSTSAIAGMILSIVLTLAGPVLLLVLWQVKQRKTHFGDSSCDKKEYSLIPALAGALTFIIAALVLESIPKYFLLSGGSGVSGYILTHAWAYALVGALLAGIFEECGRFVTFRYILKNYRNRETAITYGIGHGGIECMLLVGMSMISNLVLAFMINNGSLALLMESLPAEQAAAYQTAVTSLTAAGFGMFLWGIWERIFAMLLHISLSVLVFVSAKNKSKFYFFPVAVLLHTLMDVPAALYQFGLLSLGVVEVLIAAFSIGSAILAHRVYQRENAG